MTNTPNKIPEFHSYEEEAAFWDTHDTADFPNEFKPVKVKVHLKPKSKIISVRFNEEEIEEVIQEANDIGIGTGTLIRMWVKEKLNYKKNVAV